MAILFAERMFTNYNTSLSRQHTVNLSFSVFYPVTYGPLLCHSVVLLAY
jgi:hypothetical protein